ncbi:YT521-B-like domain-containing protein [Cantharellus anzutake]|uniref:YT521-B-like domain-containing protein n=1 Tax=Cantharellus anzutake TaxID=1750568 RepID=UPI001904B5A9|nr:YT521-B-like domain-containing protein [Cantharellus anzutake]KAF8328144.1 YT521-B-like domain-containing protein [Cantharellus anzutake]
MVYPQSPAYLHSQRGPVAPSASMSGPYIYPTQLPTDQGPELWYYSSSLHIASQHAYGEPSAPGLSRFAGSVSQPASSSTSGPIAPLRSTEIGTRPRPRLAERASTIDRHSYQSNTPANRSEWVMWVGNVPADSTKEELERFFASVSAHTPSPQHVPGSRPEMETRSKSGIQSIFLMPTSHCAFVNYDTEAHLLHAVAICNGHPLRPNDPRCPNLVCTVRGPEDALRAGVGAQRGTGMHTRWVQQKHAREKCTESGAVTMRPLVRGRLSPSSPVDAFIRGEQPALAQITQPESSENIQHSQSTEDSHINETDESSASGSFASTDSSFLATHFPQRYFILKSLTQHDLDLSVETKLWATQLHNEPILDQAYRTSQEVFLIFSANKSGEFFGYARMVGPINVSHARHVPWSSRSEGPSRTRQESVKGPETSTLNSEPLFLSPSESNPLHHSPQALDIEDPVRSSLAASSAPPEMNQPFRRISRPAEARNVAGTFDDAKVFHFNLEREAPKKNLAFRSMQHSRDDADDPLPEFGSLMIDFPSSSPTHPQEQGGSSNDTSPETNPLAQVTTRSGPGATASWGTPFPIQWIRVQALPFYRTKHLRNPWNSNHGVQVSRDGTELEPEVGGRLLAQWNQLPPVGE